MRAVVLDCPDPRVLAEFYRGLVGGEITFDDGDWVSLRDGGEVRLSFQRVDDHQPPGWPDGDPPQQFHIDVTVDDVDAAEAEVLALGATKHPNQPGDPSEDADDWWRVYLDPAGHPFCLCWDP
jgi:hypothetical protein